MIFTKAKPARIGGWLGPKYTCRKDWRVKSWYAKFSKRPYKKITNEIVRRYKGDIPNGNFYKKLFDLEYTIW